MIYLGYSQDERLRIIGDYRREHAIAHTVVITPAMFPLPVPDSDTVDYVDVIMYVTFYRLLQEIDKSTLIVLNECLRTQNRYDLAYNCIRNYLNQTEHVLIFQTLPQIDTEEDFMILFDWDTRSRWKREHFNPELIHDNSNVHVRTRDFHFERIDVPTPDATKRRYEAEREKRFAELGARDPHTIPRNLYQLGGKDKKRWMDEEPAPTLFCLGEPIERHYVARNQRLSSASVSTYDKATIDNIPYTVIEFPHRFIDWCDFVTVTGQTEFDVLVADLKVDQWYFDRYVAWKERLNATYASLRR